ncbi:MAG TPA: DUF72 domain-containing protein [Bryobacteraceae bacterium]|nr:DUF72 domain-containing protein [Bryobacteraceae bacterium]
MAAVLAGTSGYAYASWKPDFYPADVPAKRFLEHYATRLNSTEINYTFHRLPAAKSLTEWVAATQPGFLFSLKAHMKLTHVMRLKECGTFLEVFLRAIDPLRTVGRLGVILFQLPPNLKCDVPLLSEFLTLLRGDVRFAFEFRHDSWLTDAVYDALSARGICLCLAESEKLVIPEVLTAPFTYFRLRKGIYSDDERSAIAARVGEMSTAERDVYVYFKHEESPAGALYAEELLRLIRPRAEPLSA